MLMDVSMRLVIVELKSHPVVNFVISQCHMVLYAVEKGDKNTVTRS